MAPSTESPVIRDDPLALDDRVRAAAIDTSLMRESRTGRTVIGSNGNPISEGNIPFDVQKSFTYSGGPYY